VNFHPSVLPLYRGPVPSYWVIRNGERRTGFTLHRITARIDDGEILDQEELPVGGLDDPAQLDQAIAARAVGTLSRYLDHLRTGAAWHKRTLDAFTVYRTHVDYCSFPDRSPPAPAREAR
jgi:methionyl-tRNA formyltransferase